jgi:hypothetical protein
MFRLFFLVGVRSVKLTAEGLLQMFRSGMDTHAIAEELQIPEADVYNALSARMRWPVWVRKKEPGAALLNEGQ